MKLSISNIAWDNENDAEVYEMMEQLQFGGLEIAPTKIFSKNPYEQLDIAETWKRKLESLYHLKISSMQSIWYGRSENIFRSREERKILLDYTKKAINFAEVMECGNLVFGCPKNRYVFEEKDRDSAISFFRELGEYAINRNTIIGMEANPIIYNTNYINTTKEAIELIEEVNSDGFRLNLDLGTMIYNRESPDELKGKVKLINHVHISEPELKLIKKRELHQKVVNLLKQENYNGYVSIEMGNQKEMKVLENVMVYIKEIFG